jgi:Tfp pilus assembly protein PilE
MGILKRQKSGFTIVELAVIIAVIGILASITVVGFGAWQKRTAGNVIKSDLVNVAAAMDSARNFSNTYPTSFPTSFKPSANVVLEMVATATGKYCINGYSTVDTSVRKSIYSDNPRQARDFMCAGVTIGSVIGGTIPATPKDVDIAPSFDTWTLTGTTTYNSTTGELTMGTNGTATSPKVRVNGVAGMNINGQFYATAQSANAGLIPNGGWHSGSLYYRADGVTGATNTGGYAGNGCAGNVTLGSWNSSSTTCNYALGNNVEYVTIVLYSSASAYASTDLKVKNLTFILY